MNTPRRADISSGSSECIRSRLRQIIPQQSEALDEIDFEQAALDAVIHALQGRQPVLRERLNHCDQLGVTRISGQLSFVIGAAGVARLLVCLVGNCQLVCLGGNRTFSQSDVLLLPASAGACACQPHGFVSLLEIALPKFAAATDGQLLR